LIDDTGVRATMTAHWLVQMGFADIHVLAGGLDNQAAQVTGADSPVIPMDMEGITPADLAADYESGRVTVIDLGESRVYRKAHIPDAHWAIRTRIADRVAGLPQEGLVVLTSADGLLAQMALAEVRALTAARVRALVGGTDAWIAAGHPTDAAPAIPPDEACVDVYLRAYDRNTGVEARMQEYIDWEVALIEQIANDPDVRFSLGPLA
jgi:3-mercaptopyruvate sulfurtransferase SseA